MTKSETMLVFTILMLIVNCDGANEYDYLQVVIQWQPTTCSDRNKPEWYQDPSNRFSIHGVWPSLYNGRPIQCVGSPFDVKLVSILFFNSKFFGMSCFYINDHNCSGEHSPTRIG